MRCSRRLAALLLLPALALGACGSDSSADADATGTRAATEGGGQTFTTDVGVTVTGGFGEKPTLDVPDTDAPAELSAEVLVQGQGPEVAAGSNLVADYLGQTWTPKDGQPNVFDNSFDRGQPLTFPVGAGEVIKGWDDTLVGQKAGSRLLLSIPAALAYGEEKTAENELSGEPLLFVVDVLGSVDAAATATGTPVADAPDGFPEVTSASGKEPVITSVEGVEPVPAGGEPRSALLLAGEGDTIDPTKLLALQILQTDLATGTQTSKTWEQKPEFVPAEQVLATLTALKDQNVGSRAVVVVPAQGETPDVALVVDVVGQF